jgi:hypothetical protein
MNLNPLIPKFQDLGCWGLGHEGLGGLGHVGLGGLGHEGLGGLGYEGLGGLGHVGLRDVESRLCAGLDFLGFDLGLRAFGNDEG